MDLKWQALAFLGLPLDPTLQSELDQNLLRLFRPYLDQTEIEKKPFMGKMIYDPLTLEQLEQLQTHVISVFKRLLPNTSLPTLQLFALTS